MEAASSLRRRDITRFWQRRLDRFNINTYLPSSFAAKAAQREVGGALTWPPLPLVQVH